MAGERERGGGHRGGREERDSEFVDKLVHINRVAKVVKGGKRFGFAALVVIGDQKGRVGFGHGKAREVPEAIRKATESAKRNLTRVALREGRTLHHDIAGRHGAGRVYLRAAPAGTGIIAGGPMRAVFETLGIQDVVAKSIGSSNPYNMVRATRVRLRLADSVALRIASGTSRALPWPKPTRPFWSPITTSAAKPNRLPPLTTFATRLMWTSLSTNSLSRSSRPPLWPPPRSRSPAMVFSDP